MNIFFKKEFLSLIFSGKKTQTIRAWLQCSLKKDDVFLINFRHKGKVKSVIQKSFHQITELEAQLDGFDSLASLRHWWTENNFPLDVSCFLIRFQLLDAKS